MNLGKLLSAYRMQHAMSLRDLASEIGIDAVSLMRCEKGALPAKKAFVKIVCWMINDTKPKRS